ncbi:MAG: HNH endonuclease [Deltaproteobacteria bacterium]|nr:HNH endonuclease [Deltaproteobacteria bacterium]
MRRRSSNLERPGGAKSPRKTPCYKGIPRQELPRSPRSTDDVRACKAPRSALPEEHDILLAELARHAAASFEQTADVLRLLGEVDRTRAWAEKPYGSLFAYCLGELNWSEGEAAKKIQAARAAQRFPLLLTRVRAGRLHLAGVVLLAAKLTDDNAVALIDAACGKSKRDVEALLAAQFPRPDVAPTIRKLPAPSRVGTSTTLTLPMSSTVREPEDARIAEKTSRPTPGRRAEVAPLSAERHKLTVTISAATRDRLARLAALTSHRSAEARSVEGLLDAALELLEAKLVKERFGVGAKPRKATAARGATPKKTPRAFPKADRRAIVARDGLRCSHVDAATGVRCSETRWLTLDHVEPWAHGGASATENGRVLCSAHNHAAARRVLGAELVRRRVDERRGRDGGEIGDAALPRRGDAGDDGVWTACGQAGDSPLRGLPRASPRGRPHPLTTRDPRPTGAEPRVAHIALENLAFDRPLAGRTRGFPHLHGACGGCWSSWGDDRTVPGDCDPAEGGHEGRPYGAWRHAVTDGSAPWQRAVSAWQHAVTDGSAS